MFQNPLIQNLKQELFCELDDAEIAALNGGRTIELVPGVRFTAEEDKILSFLLG
jgi:hypothetical protein